MIEKDSLITIIRKKTTIIWW